MSTNARANEITDEDRARITETAKEWALDYHGLGIDRSDAHCRLVADQIRRHIGLRGSRARFQFALQAYTRERERLRLSR